MSKEVSHIKQEQESVLSLFHNIHQSLLSGKSIQEIYESIGNALIEFFTDYTVSIATLNVSTATETFAYHWDGGERKYPEAQVYNKLRHELVTEHSSILVNEGAAKFVEEHLGDDYAERSGISIPLSFVFAPFIINEEVRGYISVKHYQKENAFTPLQVKFIQVLSGNISVAIQNAELLSSEQNKSKEQAALLESMKDLSRKPDLKNLLDAVLERAVNLLGVTGGELAIYHPSSREMEVVASLNLGWQYSGVRLQIGEGAVGTVASTKSHLLIPNYQTWEGRSKQYEKTIVHAVMAIPLLLDQQLLGVLCAVHLEDNRIFNEDDLAHLNLFAPIAAIAINNAKLLEAQKQKADEQEALLETMHDLSAKLNLNVLLQSVVERSVELLKVTGGELAIYHSDENELEIVASHNLGMESLGLRMQLGEGAMGSAALEKESIVIPDYQTWIAKSNKYQETKVHGVVAIPLLIKDQLVGVLCIVHLDKDRKFNEDDLRLLSLFAPLAATAIENARLFDKTNRLLEITAQREKELKSTQSQLIQSEKMASLGELTAGIAHEIQNPLNFVNNFSELNVELTAELRVKNEELGIKNNDINDLVSDIQSNSQKINHHGKRASDIVKGMLQHSRTSTGQKELTDINALCDEYLRLAYHGLRAKDKTFNAQFETHFDENLPKVNVVPQDMGRVVLNIINNAFFAVAKQSEIFNLKSGRQEVGTSDRQNGDDPTIRRPDEEYFPMVSISTRKQANTIEVIISDNGGGIPNEIKEKIFQPFFTTKPTGQGTGLGLSLAYDIVTKVHGGKLTVESEVGNGTIFKIEIPA